MYVGLRTVTTSSVSMPGLLNFEEAVMRAPRMFGTLFRACVIGSLLAQDVACVRSASVPRQGWASSSDASSWASEGELTALASSEIATMREGTAFELVQRHRPAFLRVHIVPDSRDPRAGIPLVYVDGMKKGPPEILETILASSVREIRYVAPTEACVLYGPQHEGGVIAVRTRQLGVMERRPRARN